MNREQARAYAQNLERRTAENVAACRQPVKPEDVASIRSMVQYIMEEERKLRKQQKKESKCQRQHR
jgi:hypothetical protein